MSSKKVLCVFGTRPEAIKMAPVILALQNESPRLQTRVCVTAQHRGMLDDVLRTFRIRPHHDLNIMQEGQTLEHVTQAVVTRLAPVLQKEKPELVLVHGDTSTTFLAALACFYQKIPVGHVEAGLRSHDFEHPFPEEGNRRMADALCALHFAPTAEAKRNLLKENIASRGIFITGNTVTDALQWACAKPHAFQNPALKKFMRAPANRSARLVLVTAHRRENFGKPFESICAALRRIADDFKDVRIVYPVHPNPNVRGPAHRILARHPCIALLEPLNYLDLAHLMKRSYCVVTDSGGLQEEAPSLGKPVLVLRQVTERPEAVRAGTAKIVGTNASAIARETARLLNNAGAYKRMANAVNPYGDGRAALRTVDAVLHYFGMKKTRPADFMP